MIEGVVTSGCGHSASWVPHQDWAPLGITPVPGTLNVDTPDHLQAVGGVEIIEHKTHHRTGAPMVVRADYVPYRLEQVDVWVRAYPDHRVEVVAAVHLRTELDLSDGDTVILHRRET